MTPAQRAILSALPATTYQAAAHAGVSAAYAHRVLHASRWQGLTEPGPELRGATWRRTAATPETTARGTLAPDWRSRRQTAIHATRIYADHGRDEWINERGATGRYMRRPGLLVVAGIIERVGWSRYRLTDYGEAIADIYEEIGGTHRYSDHLDLADHLGREPAEVERVVRHLCMTYHLPIRDTA